ncbi:hypothetical protein F5148DRAFT_1151213 [Russula earlei]|uniref:Uncharacterized protein n=1 Tax=Russula earlei TaxID=71964 RepID=A0ACC0U157_9AGAM|nr:hypothetical protein F5148DRAFT_1151213 [Russula earlei]
MHHQAEAQLNHICLQFKACATQFPATPESSVSVSTGLYQTKFPLVGLYKTEDNGQDTKSRANPVLAVTSVASELRTWTADRLYGGLSITEDNMQDQFSQFKDANSQLSARPPVEALELHQRKRVLSHVMMEEDSEEDRAQYQYHGFVDIKSDVEALEGTQSPLDRSPLVTSHCSDNSRETSMESSFMILGLLDDANRTLSTLSRSVRYEDHHTTDMFDAYGLTVDSVSYHLSRSSQRTLNRLPNNALIISHEKETNVKYHSFMMGSSEGAHIRLGLLAKGKSDDLRLFVRRPTCRPVTSAAHTLSVPLENSHEASRRLVKKLLELGAMLVVFLTVPEVPATKKFICLAFRSDKKWTTNGWWVTSGLYGLQVKASILPRKYRKASRAIRSRHPTLTANSAFVAFDDVRVSVEYTLDLYGVPLYKERVIEPRLSDCFLEVYSDPWGGAVTLTAMGHFTELAGGPLVVELNCVLLCPVSRDDPV